MEANKKRLKIIVPLVLVALIILIIVFINFSKFKAQAPVGTNLPGQFQEELTALVTSELASVEYAIQTYETLSGATVEIPGASLVSKDNQVMTYTGEMADNTVEPGSALAPKSVIVNSKNELPVTAINLDISSSGFFPNTFTVEANSPVTLALTSVDNSAHVIAFDDPILKAVKFGVIGGEIRAMTFAAPSTPGTYSFFCEVPGHKEREEIGTMVVK